MAGSNTTALQTKYNAMMDYYDQWQKWKKQFVDDHNLVIDLERQLKVHQASGAVNDAENVARQLNDAYGTQGNSNAQQQKYEQLYKDAKKEYDAAYALLTPKEQQQISNAVDAEINQKNAEAEATKAKAIIDAQAANYATSRSQLLLYAGVGTLLIAAGLFVYFKFFKKSPL